MAENERNREDLLREATALVERIEFDAPSFTESIVAGFRRSGSVSFYFGADPVYQFTSQGALRRAFIEGRLLKAEHGRLAALMRQRQPGRTLLVRTELPADEAGAVLAAARQLLGRLLAALQADPHSPDAIQIRGQAPPEAPVAARLADWLQNHLPSLHIAQAPRDA